MPEPPAQVVARVTHDLAQHGTPARAAGAKAYLKSDLEFLGVEVPRVRKAVAALLADEGKALGRDRLVALAAAFWKQPVWELRGVAVGLLEKRAKLLGPDDLPLVERLTREAGGWALADWLSIHVAGPILATHPKELRHLDRWAKDDDVWVRRLALTCQRNALSKGTADWPRFRRIADGMLAETEPFIRKAIGWMLREAGKADPEAVAAYVAERAGRMAGLTFREATRSLPGHLKEAVEAQRQATTSPAKTW